MLPETHETISFDNLGDCSVCNNFSHKSKKINWKNKADNILEISKELNIGLNSIVFFDDSKYERGLVREMLPDINIVDVPENFIDYPLALANHEFFDYLLLILFRSSLLRRSALVRAKSSGEGGINFALLRRIKINFALLRRIKT